VKSLNKMATPKQQKLIKLLLENLGKQGKTKSLGKLILEAGYTKAMAKNPQMILESQTIKEGLSDFVKDMIERRKKALSEITDSKLKSSQARDLSNIVDTLTKNIQLLSGGNTEKSEMKISWKK